jgi:hypothetical protein
VAFDEAQRILHAGLVRSSICTATYGSETAHNLDTDSIGKKSATGGQCQYGPGGPDHAIEWHGVGDQLGRRRANW